jgi:hypothetical protein
MRIPQGATPPADERDVDEAAQASALLGKARTREPIPPRAACSATPMQAGRFADLDLLAKGGMRTFAHTPVEGLRDSLTPIKGYVWRAYPWRVSWVRVYESGRQLRRPST